MAEEKNEWNCQNMPCPPIVTVRTKLEITSAEQQRHMQSAFFVFLKKLKNNWEDIEKECLHLAHFVYSKNNSCRLDKSLSGAKRVLSCLKRFSSLNFLQFCEDFNEIITRCEMYKNEEIYLPSQQMIEYLLIRLTSLANLFEKVQGYCIYACNYSRQQLGMGHFLSDNMFFISMISKLWSLSQEVSRDAAKIFRPILKAFVPIYPPIKIHRSLQQTLKVLNYPSGGHAEERMTQDENAIKEEPTFEDRVMATSRGEDIGETVSRKEPNRNLKDQTDHNSVEQPLGSDHNQADCNAKTKGGQKAFIKTIKQIKQAESISLIIKVLRQFLKKMKANQDKKTVMLKLKRLQRKDSNSDKCLNLGKKLAVSTVKEFKPISKKKDEGVKTVSKHSNTLSKDIKGNKKIRRKRHEVKSEDKKVKKMKNKKAERKLKLQSHTISAHDTKKMVHNRAKKNRRNIKIKKI